MKSWGGKPEAREARSVPVRRACHQDAQKARVAVLQAHGRGPGMKAGGRGREADYMALLVTTRSSDYFLRST